MARKRVPRKRSWMLRGNGGGVKPAKGRTGSTSSGGWTKWKKKARRIIRRWLPIWEPGMGLA